MWEHFPLWKAADNGSILDFYSFLFPASIQRPIRLLIFLLVLFLTVAYDRLLTLDVSFYLNCSLLRFVLLGTTLSPLYAL